MFDANYAKKLNNYAGTAPSIGAIWDEFSTKAPKRYHINAQLALFSVRNVLI